MPQYLADNNVPWTMWDYTGGFGLFEAGGNDLFDYDLNIPLIEAMGLNAPEQKEFILKPDTIGFDIYTDYFATHISNGSWGDGIIDFYNTDAVIGPFCILMSELGQYNNTAFNFRPIKDLTTLVAKGYALDVWLKSDYEDMKIDIRFVDTKTDDPDDHPWRIKKTIDKKMGQWDGAWKRLQIPLSDFEEGGSWDDGWFEPKGDFDWAQLNTLEVVAEHHDFKGKKLWVDNIRIVDPQIVAVGDSPEFPQEFSLKQNYPNPFNPTTKINYRLAVNKNVQILIYNSVGQKIRTLVNDAQPAGRHSVLWDGRDDAGLTVSSGVYLYRLKTGDFVETRKMILMR